MKKNKIMYLFFCFLLLSLETSCIEDDYDIGAINAPTDLEVSTQVVGQTEDMPFGDGSGKVQFKASANHVMTYKFLYGDGFEEVSHDGNTSHSFSKNGINDYTVTVIASGMAGVSSNITTSVKVFSDFSDPETAQLLTGGNSKTWYVAAAEPWHIGVGASNGEGFTAPTYYAAAPFEKGAEEVSSCFYADELTFSLNGENIQYELDNKGKTFFNAAYSGDFGGDGSEDQCLDFDTSGIKDVSLSPSTSGLPEDATTGTVINISNSGFMSYYIGASAYEILSISENRIYVRAIMGNDPGLAWYLKFSTTPPDAQEPEEPEEFESQYQDLIWIEAFDEDGVPNPEIWNFEMGNNNGWGNQEAQYYTQDNAVVEDGKLRITAKAETISGFAYSSSRITTQDNFEFQYGRVEIRAKMPSGGGVWPALWMLGSNFDEVGWPESGELDIMEFVGNDPNIIHGTVHYPEHAGGNADTGTTSIENASSEFHIYELEWTPEKIVFILDGKPFHSYENTPDSPFNQDFFLILNIAMGGNFGGEIDPDFKESSMWVDYIKVYQ